jgi:hypothetical protein
MALNKKERLQSDPGRSMLPSHFYRVTPCIMGGLS